MRWKLLVAAAAVTLAYGACGGGDEKEAEDGGKDSTSPEAGSRSDAGLGGAGDAALFEFADLDDGVSGKACTADSDCGGKGGACSDGTCTGFCEANVNCGAGGTCVSPIRNRPGLCSKVCKSKSDCASSLDCREGLDLGDIVGDFAGQLADAGVELDSDSGIDDVANLPKTCGMSLGTVDLPNGIVGTPCTTDTQCGPGLCLSNINGLEPFSAGYCSGKCLTNDQCGTGGVCYKDPITEALKLEGRCLLGCSGGSATGCRTGQVCRISDIIDDDSYCLPPVPVVDAGTTTDAGTGDGG